MAQKKLMVLLVIFASACGSPNTNNEPNVPVVEPGRFANLVAPEVCTETFEAHQPIVTLNTDTCPSCRAENLEAMVDGDYDTKGTIYFGGAGEHSSGTFTLRVATTDGHQVMTDQKAGPFMSFNPLKATFTWAAGSYSRRLTYYANGAPVATQPVGSSTVDADGETRDSFQLAGGTTPAPPLYDAIELEITWSDVTEPLHLNFSEFCAAGRDTEARPPGVSFGPSGSAERNPDPNPPVAAPNAAGNYEVEMLVLLTPRYIQAFGGFANAVVEVDRQMSVAQAYFTASSIPVELVVKDVQEYSGISESRRPRENFTTVADDADLYDYVTELGVDLVYTFRTRDLDVGTICGAAAGFNGTNQSDTADQVDIRLDSFLISSMGPGVNHPACPDSTVAHELGHSLSAGHSFGTYWKPYGLASSCGDADGNLRLTVTHEDNLPSNDAGVFSSPLLSANGAPCGADGQRDNRRAMIEALPYVAAYR